MKVILALMGVLVVITAAAADSAPGAKALYTQRCMFCHGGEGKGDGPAGASLKPRPTDFTDPAFWKTAKPEQLEEIIKHGKPGTAMIPFGQAFTQAQIDALVDYLKTFAKESRK